MTRRLIAVAIAVTAVAFAACDDSPTMPIDPALAVAFRDPAANFHLLKTFVLVDTVAHLANTQFGSTNLTTRPGWVTRDLDGVVLNQVRMNLFARGFIENPRPDATPSDFVVLVGVTATARWPAYESYPWFTWYGFYPGWALYGAFDTNWGIVYPWASVVDVVWFNPGTLIVDFVNPRFRNPVDKTITSLWVGAAETFPAGVPDTIGVTRAIDEMFIRSPYMVARIEPILFVGNRRMAHSRAR